MKLYTVGYEKLNIYDFIQKLVANNIELLIDVRAVPLSRKPGFSKTKLGEYLAQSNIAYKHFSELGTPDNLRAARKKTLTLKQFFSRYKKHALTKPVQEGLSEVEKLAKKHRAALFCFERDAKECHRSVLAQHLENKFEIVNI